MAGGVCRVLFDTDMLARLRARGAVRGLRGVRPAGSTVRRPLLSVGALTHSRASGRGLALRFVSGIFAVPFLLGVAYLGEPVYGAFICLACAYAAFEIRSMLRAGGFAPVDLVLFGTAILLPPRSWLRPEGDGLATPPHGLV